MMHPLPCPFCGCLPVVCPDSPKVEGNCWGRVECNNRACVSCPSVWDGVGVNDERGSDAYKEAAIVRWNTRAVAIKSSPAREIIAEMKAHLWGMIAQGHASTEEMRLHQKIVDWEAL